jgi:hypothetical protein
MSKHTPGPWVVHPIEFTMGLPYTPVAANTLIAKVYSTAYGDHEQSQANARIMASALDLLEALKSAKNTLVAFKFLPGPSNAWEEHDEAALQAVDAAIAKAEAA